MASLEVNNIKVIETKAWLIDIIKYPSKYRGIPELNLALKSQTGLAKMTDHERHIVSCSLNTLKSSSESLLENGFAELDTLRINAKEAIEAVTIEHRAGKATRVTLKNKVFELESKLNQIQKSNLLLSTIVSELRRELKLMVYSENNLEQRKSRYNDLNRIIEVKFSFAVNGES